LFEEATFANVNENIEIIVGERETPKGQEGRSRVMMLIR
jgi:hypothetical protein